jgi:hypothetical protein
VNARCSPPSPPHATSASSVRPPPGVRRFLYERRPGRRRPGRSRRRASPATSRRRPHLPRHPRRASERITADDVLAARAAGVDDLALEEAVRISALFMSSTGSWTRPEPARSKDDLWTSPARSSWEGATSCRRPSAGSPVAVDPASENGTRASAGARDRQAVLWNLTTPSSGTHLSSWRQRANGSRQTDRGLGQARPQPEWLIREVLSVRHAPSNATPHANTPSFAYSQASNATMTRVCTG